MTREALDRLPIGTRVYYHKPGRTDHGDEGQVCNDNPDYSGIKDIRWDDGTFAGPNNIRYVRTFHSGSVIHAQVYRQGAFGGMLNTTACGRVSGRGSDNNVSTNQLEVTCKFCLKKLAVVERKPEPSEGAK